MLKRDRAALEQLVIGFNASTHQAESGIQKLRATADGAGREIEHQLGRSISLKDDLNFLTTRGDRLADRLDALVRAARPLGQDRPFEERPAWDRSSTRPSTPDRPPNAGDVTTNQGADQVERDLLQALRMAR